MVASFSDPELGTHEIDGVLTETCFQTHVGSIQASRFIGFIVCASK